MNGTACIVEIDTGTAVIRVRGDRIVDIDTAVYRIKDLETRDLTSPHVDP
jgi:7,8-dihydro-6-hydroxymethylpterin-pyrophosphokinase